MGGCDLLEFGFNTYKNIQCSCVLIAFWLLGGIKTFHHISGVQNVAIVSHFNIQQTQSSIYIRSVCVHLMDVGPTSHYNSTLGR